MFEFCLLLLLFSLYNLETKISISDFQKVLVPFKEGNCDYTLNYILIGSSNFKNKN